jgi:CRISPR-associated protein Csx17
MTLHVHKLEGCAPTPLAHYLKALAILRLVSEQRDLKARGFWKDEAFWLVTDLSRDDVVRFFLDEYRPTPILSPWNGGSGFYFREEKSKEKDETGKRAKTGLRNEPTAATRALASLLASTSDRLRPYRECAAVAKSVVESLELTQAPGDADKARLIATLRSRLPDVRWIDASVTSLGDDFECAPLVGSGGNDGNEDFSKNFLERILSLIGPEAGETRALLLSSLFAEAAPGAFDFAPGQFFPGGNAGVNAGVGFSGKPTSNPWEYVFALEGALAFAGAASRRFESLTGGAAFPFAVRVDPAGYSSAGEADREGSRFEVWLPIWQQATDLAGVIALLGDGRVRVDGADARRSVDVARAIASFGTSRGVSGFERTAFFTRNGNMHYAVPAGRWAASSQPRKELDLLHDVGRWVDRLRRIAQGGSAPQTLMSAIHVIDEALLGVCRAGSDSRNWEALLIAIGRGENALLHSPRIAGDPKNELTPLPQLRVQWLSAIDDNSPEFRLAAALASQEVTLLLKGREIRKPVSAHWMPLDRAIPASRFATDASGLVSDPDVVCTGDDLERDCIALLRRRVQMAPALKNRGLGVYPLEGAEARLTDVMAFLSGDVDDRRILALARPLMALKWSEGTAQARRLAPRVVAGDTSRVDAAYAVARVTHLPSPQALRSSMPIRLDAEPIARLVAGQLWPAMDVCLRRLASSGFVPVVHFFAGDRRYARRLAAALAFPIQASDMQWCLRLVTKQQATHPV